MSNNNSLITSPTSSQDSQLSITNVGRSHANAPFAVKQMLTLAKASALSGFYKDAKDVNKALVKMMIGHELGIGPGAALSGIYVVQDKIVLSANLIAGLIKRSGLYDYKVVRLDDEGCILEFFSISATSGERESLGRSEFTKAHAEKAGLFSKPGPWKVYPRNMFFSRALTNGQKWFCPDLTAGAPVYTPDEVGLQEDEEGNVATPKTSPELVKKLVELVAATETQATKLYGHYGVETPEELGDENANAAIKILEQKLSVRRQLEQQQASQPQQLQAPHNNEVEPEAVTVTSNKKETK